MNNSITDVPGLLVGQADDAEALTGCTVAAPVTEGPQPRESIAPSMTAPIETPPPGDVQAVSATRPTAGAEDAMAKCHIGDMIPIEKVTGMGQIAAAKDLIHYLPLTGREPQLREEGPAWIIQIQAEVPQPGSTEVWIDPTCVVTQGEFGYFATGPVRDTATGKVLTPEPPVMPPDRTLPPLAP